MFISLCTLLTSKFSAMKDWKKYKIKKNKKVFDNNNYNLFIANKSISRCGCCYLL